MLHPHDVRRDGGLEVVQKHVGAKHVAAEFETLHFADITLGGGNHLFRGFMEFHIRVADADRAFRRGKRQEIHVAYERG